MEMDNFAKEKRFSCGHEKDHVERWEYKGLTMLVMELLSTYIQDTDQH
jgi:hypothetical protein